MLYREEEIYQRCNIVEGSASMLRKKLSQNNFLNFCPKNEKQRPENIRQSCARLADVA